MSELFVNGIVGAQHYEYNRAKKAEKRANNLSTITGTAVLAGIPYAVSKFKLLDTVPMARAEYFLSNKIEKVMEKFTKYCRNAHDYAMKTLNNTRTNNPKLYNKFAKSKVAELLDKIINSGTTWDTICKIKGKYRDFKQLSKINQGKKVFITVGIGLLACAGYKLLSHYFRKDGAIDQKYNDIENFSKLL